jgi:hypothetical protein
MDRIINKYRFRNVVLEAKPKTMDNVLSSIHFYLPDSRQEHLRVGSSNFVHCAPRNLHAQTRKMQALTAADWAVVSTLRVTLSYLQDKCMTVVFSNDSFLSSFLKSLAYKYLFPELEVHLVTVTSLILRWLVTYHKILYCLTRQHFPKLWTFTLTFWHRSFTFKFYHTLYVKSE